MSVTRNMNWRKHEKNCEGKPNVSTGYGVLSPWRVSAGKGSNSRSRDSLPHHRNHHPDIEMAI